MIMASTAQKTVKETLKTEDLKFRADKRRQKQQEEYEELKEHEQKGQKIGTWKSAKRFIKTVVVEMILITGLATADDTVYNYNTIQSHRPNPIHTQQKSGYSKFRAGSAWENFKMVEYIPKTTNKIEATFKGTYQNESDFTDNRVVANGLTDEGWWYQYGIAIGKIDGEISIRATYEFWDNRGKSVYPANDKSGHQFFWGNVNPNDKFYISLEIRNGHIIANAKDLTTGAYAEMEHIAHGSRFVGNQNFNKEGYSTSIFREIWETRFLIL